MEIIDQITIKEYSQAETHIYQEICSKKINLELTAPEMQQTGFISCINGIISISHNYKIEIYGNIIELNLKIDPRHNGWYETQKILIPNPQDYNIIITEYFLTITNKNDNRTPQQLIKEFYKHE